MTRSSARSCCGAALSLGEGCDGRSRHGVVADGRGGLMRGRERMLRNPAALLLVEPATIRARRSGGGQSSMAAWFRPGHVGCGIWSMELLKSGQQGSVPFGACRGEDTGCTAPHPLLKAATTPTWTTYSSAPGAPTGRDGVLRPRYWSGPIWRKRNRRADAAPDASRGCGRSEANAFSMTDRHRRRNHALAQVGRTVPGHPCADSARPAVRTARSRAATLKTEGDGRRWTREHAGPHRRCTG